MITPIVDLDSIAVHVVDPDASRAFYRDPSGNEFRLIQRDRPLPPRDPICDIAYALAPDKVKHLGRVRSRGGHPCEHRSSSSPF